MNQNWQSLDPANPPIADMEQTGFVVLNATSYSDATVIMTVGLFVQAPDTVYWMPHCEKSIPSQPVYHLCARYRAWYYVLPGFDGELE